MRRRCCAILDNARPDFIALAGYMRLLSPAFIAAYPMRILNIHPSLLPAFPGVDAQAQAVAYGVKISGCTVHFVDENLDAGPIIVQRAVRSASGRRRLHARRAHPRRGARRVRGGVGEAGVRQVSRRRTRVV